jgi:SAM-dependent methyltransferase
MLEISHWFGRFGNNILQIVRCIHFAIVHNQTHIKIPYHDYLSQTDIHIDISNNKDNSNNSMNINNIFYYLKTFGIEEPSSATLRKYAQKYILPILKITPTYLPTSLVLHCRGGDIFTSNPHKLYVQPPLSYYEAILNKNTSAILIYEDKSNPCVPILLENLKVKGQSSTIDHDFSVLLGAEIIVGGFSSFLYAAYLLSTNIKCIYFPDYFINILPKGPYDINVISVKLPNYIEPGKWENTEKQLRQIIEYNITMETNLQISTNHRETELIYEPLGTNRLKYIENVIDNLKLQKGAKILDFGGNQFRQYCNNNNFIYEMLDLYEPQKNGSGGYFGGGLTYDGRNIPLKNDSFDVIIISFVLHHTSSNTIHLLKQLKNITKKYLIICEDLCAIDYPLNWHERCFLHQKEGIYRSDEEWKFIFEALDLKLIDILNIRCNRDREFSDPFKYIYRIQYLLQK